MLKQLWSPWRSVYLEGNDPQAGGCFLCDAVANQENTFSNLVVWRGKSVIALLNKYPYNAGHLLIAGHSHVSDLLDIPADEYTELMDSIRDSLAVVRKLMMPHGVNIGINLGRDAGAGCPDHVHFHVIPRWRGDHNFMSTVSDVRVISSDMEKYWQDCLLLFNNPAT